MSSAHALRLLQRTGSDSNSLQYNLSHDVQYDLLAGLWQESPFVRLPVDAPPELKSCVRNIDNPRRVHAIHLASRRHDFQLLVELYIQQLRDGCGSDTCLTPTCFTCRRRLVGKAPIRRYNPTSARTLAVHLASQDNPERGICPALRRSKDAPPAVGNLVFSRCSLPKNRAPDHDVQMQKQRRGSASHDTRTSCEGVATPDEKLHGDMEFQQQDASQPAEICIAERPIRIDHRSFAATTFSTVAFKMLEWLTPNSFESLSQKVSNLKSSVASPSNQATESSASAPTIQNRDAHIKDNADDKGSPRSLKQLPHPDTSNAQDSRTKKDQMASKRSSKTTFRPVSSVETARRKSIEPVCVTAENDSTSLHRSTRFSGYHPDKLSRRTKSPPTTITIKPTFFENVALPQSAADEATVTSSDGEESTTKNKVSQLASLDGNHEHKQNQQSTAKLQDDDSVDDSKSIDNLLPQSLSHLNVDIINFIGDVYAEDQTFEGEFFAASDASFHYPRPNNYRKRLVRRSQTRLQVCKNQWKAFHEQTLFNILSDPVTLVSSFTHNGNLFDSHTLWYCMVRLTRASPSLVLHSLWLSAASLFRLPELKTPTEKGQLRRITASQAESIMSVCLHALVALVPVVSDSNALFDLSRIRSHGYALSNSASLYRRSSSICLDYNDVFSNSLALRLARRLFLAIIRQQVTNLPLTTIGNGNMLDLLLKQLNMRNIGSERILDFAQEERVLHETRVPTLLLDWARAVLLLEWDGEAYFNKDGAFFGALSFMKVFYANRNGLILGDVQFRVECFSERLDAMRIPVQWMTAKPIDGTGNLLDFPFLFCSETLVTFFRSINFFNMSRAFEEASSLKRRMNAIVDPGSLITNPHHQAVLKDRLKVAASKYLVLNIGRETVLRDTFDQLWRRQERELLRPLKIHLGEEAGEEGFDSGGVQQEFFRLALAECLDPVYGAFTVDERNHMAWFKPQAVVEDWKFELIGLLLSLAVYNGLTLPVNFPKAFYRKLLGEPVDQLYHLADGWPDLVSGLDTLLEWDEKNGLIEDVFARTYEFSAPGIGKVFTIHMLADKHKDMPGSPISDDEDAEEAPFVTGENRHGYVTDYIRYLTDYSVRKQFDSFRRGFLACLPEKSLALLSPPILQSIVEGVQEIEITELRRYARYVGWDASHRTVRDFWSIVRRYDDVMKRKLLEFVTASDRVPVSGLKNVQFIIQKNGAEDGEGGHLPTAYTCYGTLLLPEYRDKEVLRERLSMALENSQGFGFA